MRGKFIYQKMAQLHYRGEWMMIDDKHTGLVFKEFIQMRAEGATFSFMLELGENLVAFERNLICSSPTRTTPLFLSFPLVLVCVNIRARAVCVRLWGSRIGKGGRGGTNSSVPAR